MTKVCHITSAHHPLDDRIFYKECLSLSKYYKVFIIAPYHQDFIEQGINIVHVKQFNQRIFRFLCLPFLIFLKVLKMKPKIVHFHDPDLIPLGFLLKLLGYKVIYDAHEFYEVQITSKPYLSQFQKKIFSKFYLFLERLSIRFFNHIIYVVDNEVVQLKANTIKGFKEKYRIIHNFPDTHLFNQNSVNKNTESRIISLVYVGGLTKKRGIKEVITALEEINNVQLILAGQWESEKYFEECKTLNAFHKVKYLGLLNHTEVPNVIESCDIGICLLYPTPNHKLALPIKIFEYFAAKKPVITNNFKLWMQYFSGACLFIDIFNKEEIINTITDLIKNPEKRLELGTNGYKLVHTKYNWENEGKKLIEIYKILLNEKV